MEATAYVLLSDAFAVASLTADQEEPVQRITIKFWWQGTGAGITLAATRTRLTVPPLVDLTSITQAQFRVEDAHGQVKTLAGSALSGATSTSVGIRCALVVGDFAAVGEYLLTGMVSVDGSTWYPTETLALTVEH